MLKQSKKKVKTFVKFLRNKLLLEGLSKPYIHSMDDDTVLDSFRKCADCDEVICTKDQQMHAILEFDTPERVFEVLYEEDQPHDSSEDENDEDEGEEYEDIKQINFNFEDLELTDLAELDLDEDEAELVDEICEGCFDAIVKHFGEEDDGPSGAHKAIDDAEDEEIVRGKWILDGTTTMTQMIDNLENFIEYMKKLRESGFELAHPIEDDYGYLIKRKG